MQPTREDRKADSEAHAMQLQIVSQSHCLPGPSQLDSDPVCDTRPLGSNKLMTVLTSLLRLSYAKQTTL